MKHVYNKALNIFIIINIFLLVLLTYISGVFVKGKNISGYYEQFFIIMRTDKHYSMAHLEAFFDMDDNFYSSLLNIEDRDYGHVELTTSARLSSSSEKLIIQNEKVSLSENDRSRTQKILMDSARFSYARYLLRLVDDHHLLNSHREFELISVSDEVLCFYEYDKTILKCLKKKVVPIP